MANKSERIFYFDALRALAILLVISLHACGHIAEIIPFDAHTIYSFHGVFATFETNFFRIGVDLFIMLSGALLLGRDWAVGGFLKKRINRLVKPFLFWSVVFSIALILASYFIPSMNFVTQFGVMDILMVFWNTITFQAPGSVVYWFFWMMLGVYLLMPLLNRWINGAEMSHVEGFLIVWMIYLVLAYSLMVPIPEVISFFVAPVGFAVLGYYLRYTERGIFKNHAVIWALILVPTIAMLLYAYSLIDVDILFIFERYSVPVMLVATGVFCLFKNSEWLNNLPVSLKNIIVSVSVCSYGMYLIHSQIMMIVRKVIYLPQNYWLDFAILLLAGFVFSWIIIYVLSKIPVLNDFIGV